MSKAVRKVLKGFIMKKKIDDFLKKVDDWFNNHRRVYNAIMIVLFVGICIVVEDLKFDTDVIEFIDFTYTNNPPSFVMLLTVLGCFELIDMIVFTFCMILELITGNSYKGILYDK